MHRIFGRAKPKEEAPPPPSIDDHLKKLNDRVPELDAKIAACDKELLEIKQQMARLRPAQQGPLKQKALAVLKRKKMYDQQRGQMQTRAFNLEQTQFAIDSVKEAQDHVQMLKYSTEALSKEQAKVDIDDIADLQDDMVDMLAETAEINEVLGRSYDVYNNVDEADLDAELAALGDDLTLGDSTSSAIGTGAAAEAAPSEGVAEPAGGGGGGGAASWIAPAPAPVPVAAGGGGGGGAPSAYPSVPAAVMLSSSGGSGAGAPAAKVAART